MRLEGCPVSVAEQVLALVSLGGVKNPYLDPAEAMRFNKAYMGWRAAMAFKRMQGREVPGQGRVLARRRGADRRSASREGRGRYGGGVSPRRKGRAGVEPVRQTSADSSREKS